MQNNISCTNFPPTIKGGMTVVASRGLGRLLGEGALGREGVLGREGALGKVDGWGVGRAG